MVSPRIPPETKKNKRPTNTNLQRSFHLFVHQTKQNPQLPQKKSPQLPQTSRSQVLFDSSCRPRRWSFPRGAGGTVPAGGVPVTSTGEPRGSKSRLLEGFRDEMITWLAWYRWFFAQPPLKNMIVKMDDFFPKIWWVKRQNIWNHHLDTVARWNPANQLIVEVGSFYGYSKKGFIHHKWCRSSSINSFPGKHTTFLANCGCF